MIGLFQYSKVAEKFWKGNLLFSETFNLPLHSLLSKNCTLVAFPPLFFGYE